MYSILTLNNIARAGLNRFDKNFCKAVTRHDNPDAIMVRSFKMHDMEFGSSLKAVGRAGAGYNNIPVEMLTERGIPVFNAPGANANAVKELTIAGMLLAARNICQAYDFTRGLTMNGESLNEAVEAGKKQFAGFELAGKKLGIIGLGAVGVEVANAACSLGMKVAGFDPKITVKNAWKLNSNITRVNTMEDIYKSCDFITFHVPLIDSTCNLFNTESLKKLPEGKIIINLSRAEVVEEDAIISGLEQGKVRCYVTDFPSERVSNLDNVIALPHLGASTKEAEENCAVLVASQLNEFLVRGNVTNAVNFPEVILQDDFEVRIVIANDNKPGMIEKITGELAQRSINIKDLLNKSNNDVAYTIVDIEDKEKNDLDEMIMNFLLIDGIRSARYCMYKDE